MHLDAKTHDELLKASSRLASKNHAGYIAEALTQVKRNPDDPVDALRLLVAMQRSAFAQRRDQKSALADVGAWLEARLLANPAMSGTRLAVELGWLRRLVMYHQEIGGQVRQNDRPQPFGRRLSQIEAKRNAVILQAPIERAQVTPSLETPPMDRVELPDRVRVRFANILKARERRKLYAKQKKKKKIKPFSLVLHPVEAPWSDDPRLGLQISTTETEGIAEVFGALAKATVPIVFEVQVPAGGRGVVSRAWL